RVLFRSAVDDDRDRGFGVARLGDAANDDERVARVLRLDQRDVRGQVDEVRRLEDARVLDRVRRECGDRGRSVLQLVRAPQAGDQDRVAARLLAGGGLLLVRILRGGRKGDGERRQRDCGTSQSARSAPCHRVLPQNDLLFSGGEYRETRRKGIVAAYLSRLAIIRPQTDSALAISTAAAAPLAPARDTARGKAARANAVGSARSRKLVSARPRATSNASSGAPASSIAAAPARISIGPYAARYSRPAMARITQCPASAPNTSVTAPVTAAMRTIFATILRAASGSRTSSG